MGKITDKLKNQIKTMYIEYNLSQSEIANKLNIKEDKVKYIIKTNGIRKSKEMEIACKKRVLTEKYGTDVPLKNKNILNKMKQTNLERYGVDNPMKSLDIQEKTKKTNLERYGVEYLSQSDDIRQKIEATNIKKYGSKTPLSSDVVKEKIKQTNLKKYGVENVMQNKDIQNKVFNTNLEKYGSISPLGNDKIQNKIKLDNMQKYGVEYAIQSKSIRHKICNTNLKKYGSISPLGNKMIQNKAKNTNIKKYGVENVMQNKDIQSKIFNTNLEKYGSISPLGNDKIQEKAKNTSLMRYGTEYPISAPEIRNKSVISNIKNNCKNYNLLRDKQQLKEFLINIPFECRNTQYCADELGVNIPTLCKWINFHNLRETIEFNNQRSQYELEIVEYIKSIYTGTIITNCRKYRYEIDIYLPELNLGIEFNGAYWHNTNIVGNKYHQNKSLYFKDLGIFIYHIFEWEWVDTNTRNIIMGHLNRLIVGKSERVIYARKCEIKEIDNASYKDFINKYHIQGFTPALYKYGLYYKDELVEVMSFGKARFNNNNCMELLRLCTKQGCIVIGGTERLFKHFLSINKTDDIISFCNIDKFKGDIYIRLGMELVSVNIPNYKYVECSTLDVKSRYQCQRHKIVRDEFDTRTETEIMKDNGYVKVEDSGTYKFIYKR